MWQASQIFLKNSQKFEQNRFKSTNITMWIQKIIKIALYALAKADTR